MSETTVSFLTEISTGGTITYPVSVRVFSTEIDQNAVNVYSAAVETLQHAMAGEFWNGSTWVSDPARDASITIRAVMSLLDQWSQMKEVQGGAEVYGSGWDPSTSKYTISGLTASNLGSVSSYLSGNSLSVTSTMNRYMGESVDQITRTIRAAGWDPVANIGTASTAITNLKTQASIYNFTNVLLNAANVIKTALILGNAYSQSDSIQQILMTDYVIAGNAMLFTEMSGLQDAININQTTLSYLNSLQDLMNQKTPETFIMQLQTLAASNPQYQVFEKSTFNQTLTNIPNFTAADVANYVALVSSGIQTGTYPVGSLFTSDASLANPSGNPPIFYLAGLSAGTFVSLQALEASKIPVAGAFTATIQQIMDNLTYLQKQITAVGADGSPLSTQIGVVFKDFLTLQTSGGTLETWVADFNTSNQGTYQTHLNNAVVASQSLNDTEREKLQEVMFVYQEFYQSASSMLSDIHQLLQSMAQNIGR